MTATDIYPGPVSGTWNEKGSPYYIHGDVTVRDGDRLVITAGTSVFFAGLFGMDVQGDLLVLGRPDSLVTISSGFSPRPGDWQHIRFYDSGSDDIIRYAVIEGGTEALRIETAPGASNVVSPRIEHVEFRTNVTGVLVYGNAECQCFSTITTRASPEIRRCTFRDNDTGIRIVGRASAAYHYPQLLGIADPVIANCVFEDNTTAISGEAVAYRQYNQSGNEGRVSPVLSNLVVRGGSLGIHLTGGAAAGNSATVDAQTTNLVAYGCNTGIRIQSNSGGNVRGTFFNSIVQGCSLAVAEAGTGVRAFAFRYGDFFDSEVLCEGCSSSFGRLVTTNARGDSVDVFFNLRSDPAFVDPGSGDFRLTPASPCVDAGSTEAEGEDGCLPPGLGERTADMGPQGGPGNCGWERAPSLRVGESAGASGDTVSVSIVLEIPGGYSCNAVEMDLSTADDRGSFIGIEAFGTLVESHHWIWEDNIEPGRLRIGLSGAEPIAGGGTLIRILLVIAGGDEGFVPVALTDAVLDDGSTALDLIDGGITILPGAASACGDVDGNGRVQAHDSALVLRNLVGEIDLTPQQRLAADASGNGDLTAWDASVILMRVVELVDSLPYDSTWASSGRMHLADGQVGGPGTVLEVPIYVTGMSGICGFHARIDFDRSLLAYDGFEPSAEFTRFQLASALDEDPSGPMVLAGAAAEPVSGDHALGTLRFTVLRAPNSETEVRIRELRWNEGSPLEDVDGAVFVPAGPRLSLSAPAPNPATDAASISYSLEEPTEVRLDLFDVGGRFVRGLESGRHEAGTHAAWINCADLPSGVYFIALSTPLDKDSRPMVVRR